MSKAVAYNQSTGQEYRKVKFQTGGLALTWTMTGQSSNCTLAKNITFEKPARERILERHGDYNSRTYSSWKAMKQRCLNVAADNYWLYGGRGITVCSRWYWFTKFLKDMGDRPEGMTLDRINPNGNYEPSNCRWATLEVQANNKRNSRKVRAQ